MRSRKFATHLANYLQDGQVVVFDKAESSFIRNRLGVSGILRTGTVDARIAIEVPARFCDLKYYPPIVECLEPWVRIGPEWHNGPPLCWVLDAQWRAVMRTSRKSSSSIISEGCTWLMNNVSDLVRKHHYCHTFRVDDWPIEWDAWRHFEAGRKDFHAERRKAQR